MVEAERGSPRARALDHGGYRPAVPLGARLSQIWGLVRHAMLLRYEMRGELSVTLQAACATTPGGAAMR